MEQRNFIHCWYLCTSFVIIHIAAFHVMISFFLLSSVRRSNWAVWFDFGSRLSSLETKYWSDCMQQKAEGILHPQIMLFLKSITHPTGMLDEFILILLLIFKLKHPQADIIDWFLTTKVIVVNKYLMGCICVYTWPWFYSFHVYDWCCHLYLYLILTRTCTDCFTLLSWFCIILHLWVQNASDCVFYLAS